MLIRICIAGALSITAMQVDPSETKWRSLASTSYQQAFGEAVPHPAIYDNPAFADCRVQRHITSVTYLRVSDVRSDVLILQLTTDGHVKRQARKRALTPSGRFRVLAFLINYPQILGPDGERLWRAAQDDMNNDHKRFAREKGYAGPLIVFENTNLLVNPWEIDPLKLEALQKHAEQKGVKVHEYDIFMTIDLNPKNPAGGLARSEVRSVYVGNYGHWTSPLNETWWKYVAATAYHHETGHLWGWDHDWTPSCGAKRPPYQPFITDPALFGWLDLDGDNIPEINDPTPYGRR